MPKNACAGCIYWWYTDIGQACHYYLGTGKLRGCLSGDYCTHKDTGGGERKKPIAKKPTTKPRAQYGEGSLCWDCVDAVPDRRGYGCPWSLEEKPIRGWDAERRDLPSVKGKSYFVHTCPLFVEGYGICGIGGVHGRAVLRDWIGYSGDSEEY